MATVKFYVPAAAFDTLFYALENAELLSYSASEIRLGTPSGITLALLSGQFNFTALGELTGGTLTGLTTYQPDGSGKTLDVSGMRVDMEALFNVALSGTEDDLGELLFGGADKFTGSSGADDLPAYGGNDTIDGGAGADTMTGGSGADIYFVRDTTDRVVETASSAAGGIDLVQSYIGTYTLPANVENGRIMSATASTLAGNTLANTLTGNAAADTLTGGDGNDTLSAGDGNDLLDGGTGGDSMTGGAGNDRYVVQSSTDKVVEASGGGSDSVSSSITYTLPTGVEKLALTGSSAVNGSGNTASNTISGNGGTNNLAGGDGNDSLYGMDGVDTLGGGNGNDLLDGGTGNDSMTGGAGNDRYVVQSSADKVIEASAGGTDSVSAGITYMLPSQIEKLSLTGSSAINGSGNSASNTITGNSAVNSLAGSDGNDSLYGMDGNDMLNGGNGNDSMTGGLGNDSYVVQASGDKLIEVSGGGTDSVSSSISFVLPSGVERLTLTGSSAINGSGNSASNKITGNAAINSLNGHDGNDVLDGGSGNDSLSGGAGLDTFRFGSALNGSTNADRLADFNVVDDTLQLENSIFNKLSTTGVLSASNFRANTSGTASDNNDFVLYETDTGKLFYDADGNGAGAKVLVATLANLAALSSADIFVT